MPWARTSEKPMIAFSGVRSSCDSVGQELALVAACHLELPALVLDLSEQPRVLDGDDRLVGEGLKQLHAGVGECGHVAVSDVDDADRLPGADHGHPDRAPHAPGPVDLPHRGRRPEIGLDVGEIEHRAVGDPPEVIGVPQGPGEPPSYISTVSLGKL